MILFFSAVYHYGWLARIIEYAFSFGFYVFCVVFFELNAWTYVDIIEGYLDVCIMSKELHTDDLYKLVKRLRYLQQDAIRVLCDTNEVDNPNIVIYYVLHDKGVVVIGVGGIEK